MEIHIGIRARSVLLFVCGLTPWKLLPSPEVTIADPQPKHLLLGR